jgi:CRP/FNR family cyclic AMP-dependent transcriptional regulator
VWSFRSDTLHALRSQRPSVDAFVLRTLVADIHRLSGLLLEALFLPVETRVLRRLLVLDEEYRGPARAAAASRSSPATPSWR